MSPISQSIRRAKPFVIKQKFIPTGKVFLGGDKSIAHRALILSALSCGKTTLYNFPLHDDSLATLNVLTALGAKIIRKSTKVLVDGCGLAGFRKPNLPIFAANSGTTLRLILGVLAGQAFETKITAGKYLSLRPMARVNYPLRLMGARICAKKRGQEEYAPIVIKGGSLQGISYRMPVASAQVKSAILLAGLAAKGKTKIIQPLITRDHTERMLKEFQADLSVKGKQIVLNPGKNLISPGKIYIPGDISSAAFFMVLASIIPGAKISMQQVSLNPTRNGIIGILKKMGAKVEILNDQKSVNFEPVGDLLIKSSQLKGTKIEPAQIPNLIDELPIIMVAACFAQGRTVIQGASELRVKETDRVNSMISNLKSMGADISVKKIGALECIMIKGGRQLYGASLKSFGDHRTAMSIIVAALAAQGQSKIDDVSCITKSFPDFLTTLQSLK